MRILWEQSEKRLPMIQEIGTHKIIHLPEIGLGCQNCEEYILICELPIVFGTSLYYVDHCIMAA